MTEDDCDPYGAKLLSTQELEEAAYEMTGGNLKDLDLEKIYRLMTVTQYVTDLCLNEVERRGELVYRDGMMLMPYASDHGVDTALTREAPHFG